MTTQIVIRPSGLWNSRAPFANYYTANRTIGIHFNVLVLAARRVRLEMVKEVERPEDRQGLRWLRRHPLTRRNDRIANFAWLGYQRSLGRTSDGALPRPTPSDFRDDIDSAVQDLYEMMVVKVSSLFELFVHCWSLNYLLALLEQPPHKWSKKQQTLADKLSPVLSSRVPNWADIYNAIPGVRNELSKLPHIKFDKKDHKSETIISQPVSDLLNAFSVIQFWRSYRNLVIHRGSLVSESFYDRYALMYEELRAPFGNDIPPIEKRKPLRFSDALPRAVATVHYRAAEHLERMLEELSAGRRGHVRAPGAKVTTIPGVLMRPNPMLMDGDHALSLLWATTNSDSVLRPIAEDLQNDARARGLRQLPNLRFQTD